MFGEEQLLTNALMIELSYVTVSSLISLDTASVRTVVSGPIIGHVVSVMNDSYTS